ncbi:acyl-CoA dehydrogenase family protein [Streptomyces sp. NPDC050145]|uniref:acyl-CoA dehydrogenase family protein n=1 Tax=Streptomyces sp. NPDC050145 TaxID=3365602 RepID=UPI0037AA5948
MTLRIPAFAHDDSDIRHALRDMLDSCSTPKEVRSAESASTRHDPALWARLTEGSWSCLTVSEERGGVGGSIADLHLALFELGRAAAPAPVRSAAVGTAVFLDRVFPGSAYAASVVRAVCGGEILVPAVVEDDSPSSVYDAATGTVTGRIPLVRDAAAASGFLLCAADGTWLTVRVADVEISHQPSLGEDNQYSLSLIAAPAEAIGTHPAAAAAWRTLRWFTEACWITGLATRALEMAVAHTSERAQFGRPIGTFQAVQHLLADCAIGIQAVNDLCRAAALVLDTHGATSPEAHVSAAEALEAVRLHARTVSRNTHQVLGGSGYVLEHDLQLYTRRIRSALLWGADSEELLELVLAHRHPTAHEEKEAA